MAKILETLIRFFRKQRKPSRPIPFAEFNPRDYGGGACYHLKFRVLEGDKWVDKSFDFHQGNDQRGWHHARCILWNHGITDCPEKLEDVTQKYLDLYNIELTHGIPYISVEQD